MPNGSEDSKRNLICFPLSFAAQTRASIPRLGFVTRQPNNIKIMVTHRESKMSHYSLLTTLNLSLLTFPETNFRFISSVSVV